jgi:uncharacterized NAD(P)/FAD-binding protein YdhS
MDLYFIMIEVLRRIAMKIAVVGAGISGASVVKSLLSHDNFNTKDQIDVYEPRESLGVGLPYVETEDESIRLNVTPDVLSVNEHNPNDFNNWLENQNEPATDFEGLVSRPAYGKYLMERFEPYFNHQQVQHIQTFVEDLEILDAHTEKPVTPEQETPYVYRLKTTEGWKETIYDAVFFTTGHPPYNDYYDLQGVKNYVHNPYPMNEKLANIDSEENIGIIGSGATGIDLMRYLFLNHSLKQPLTFYDIKTPFNFVNIPLEQEDITFTFSKEWIAVEKEKQDVFIPLEVLLETFKADMEAENVDAKAVYEKYKAGTLAAKREAFETKDQKLAVVHEHVSRLVAVLPYLFNALSGEDKQYYLDHYHAKLLFFKSRVPYTTYKWLFELLDAGRVRAVTGLKDIEVAEDGSFLITADQEEQADLLVNATGFNTKLLSIADTSPLIKNLYHKEIILPHKNGHFVLVDWPQCRLINQRYDLLENVFFLGLLIGSTQYENNDASLTIDQATYSATWFMEQRTK